MTRNGKIARLPHEVREKMNRRLYNGMPAVRLVEWLNRLPEVRQRLDEIFEGRLITTQNLSEWKQGGYREWVARHEITNDAYGLALECRELAEDMKGKLGDYLATAVEARLAAALHTWNGKGRPPRQLKVLRGLCRDVALLRRGDHSRARVELEEERLERDRWRTQRELVEQFERWAADPKVRDWFFEAWGVPEERRKRLYEMFGMNPPETNHDEKKEKEEALSGDQETRNGKDCGIQSAECGAPTASGELRNGEEDDDEAEAEDEEAKTEESEEEEAETGEDESGTEEEETEVESDQTAVKSDEKEAEIKAEESTPTPAKEAPVQEEVKGGQEEPKIEGAEKNPTKSECRTKQVGPAPIGGAGRACTQGETI